MAADLRRERAAGQPLKAAFHAVARRLGLSPRRVRAYHHREVEAEDERAAELLAAHAAMREELDALCARLDAIRGLIGVDVPGAPPRRPRDRSRGQVAPHRSMPGRRPRCAPPGPRA